MASQTRAVSAIGVVTWSNPTYAYSLDDSCTSESTDGQAQEYRFSGDNFSIPSGATIDGIEVTTYRASDDGDDKYDITLVDSTYTDRTKNGTTGGSPACSNRTAETLGSPNDLWSGTWTVSHINSNYAWLKLVKSKVAKGGFTYVDYIEVTVYYTEAAPSVGGILAQVI